MSDREEYGCPEHGPSGVDYCPKCAEAPEPLTDEELQAIEHRLSTATITNAGGPDAEGRYPFADPIAGHAQRLVAEVRRLRALHYDEVLDDIGKLREAVRDAVEVARRLRSDEWLRAAAEEIEREEGGRGRGDYYMAILRKHRDGKAGEPFEDSVAREWLPCDVSTWCFTHKRHCGRDGKA